MSTTDRNEHLMSITTEPQPLREHVIVHLAAGPQDRLSLITTVVAALERAGDEAAAEAFTELTEYCASDADLLTLIRSTVTTI
jgi:phosphate uptake regulator